jgi:hypothetical protein
MYVKVEAVHEAGNAQIQMRCAHCRNLGTFDHVGGSDKLIIPDGTIVGSRRCPNPDSRAHVFAARSAGKAFLGYMTQQRSASSASAAR